jgi:hypothetical protein
MNAFVVAAVFSTLSFYCLGAGLMEHFAVDRTWPHVGEREFPLVHSVGGKATMIVYVAPLLALLFFTIVLFWVRPTGIAVGLVWASLTCHVVTWVSSAFIQIPIQMKIDKRKDMVLIERLIRTDWIRIAALVAHTAVAVGMLYQLSRSFG